MTSSYETILREVESLSETEQLRLVTQVSARLQASCVREIIYQHSRSTGSRMPI
jgi:hypothetical protein